MVDNKSYWVILVCCMCVVHCAVPRSTCSKDGECGQDEKCVYQFNFYPEQEFIFCPSTLFHCTCQKGSDERPEKFRMLKKPKRGSSPVCLYNSFYVKEYDDGTSHCFCSEPSDNTFLCNLSSKRRRNQKLK